MDTLLGAYYINNLYTIENSKTMALNWPADSRRLLLCFWINVLKLFGISAVRTVIDRVYLKKKINKIISIQPTLIFLMNFKHPHHIQYHDKNLLVL